MSEIFDLNLFVAAWQSRTLNKVLSDKEELTRMLAAYGEKEAGLSILMRETTPQYNIFEVLNIRHYEARVHTPFLAHLLDPKASHHQGRLFFDLFLKELLGIADPAAASHITVCQEKRHSDFGQCDLELWCTIDGSRKAVVVENKIYHHDGQEQLQRYYNYLKSEQVADKDLLLIYLTPHGKEPSLQSAGAVPTGLIRTMSYSGDIQRWLSVALASIAQNSLSHTLHQYLKIIQSL